MIVFMKNCFLLIAIASFLLGCSGNKKENTLQDEVLQLLIYHQTMCLRLLYYH